MKPFTFQTTPNVLFEPGASKKLPEIVAGLKAKRVLLVTDKGVRDVGLTAPAEKALAEAGVEIDGFDDVKADPPASVIE
ncbi:iron-containing alcohol dehydrogenase, partial [Methylobacterium hispanicum]